MSEGGVGRMFSTRLAPCCWNTVLYAAVGPWVWLLETNAQTCSGFTDPVGFVVGIDGLDIDRCITPSNGGGDEWYPSWCLDDGHLASDVLGTGEI